MILLLVFCSGLARQLEWDQLDLLLQHGLHDRDLGFPNFRRASLIVYPPGPTMIYDIKRAPPSLPDLKSSKQPGTDQTITRNLPPPQN